MKELRKCKCGSSEFVALESWCWGGELEEKVLYLRNPEEKEIEKIECIKCGEELPDNFEIEFV